MNRSVHFLALLVPLAVISSPAQAAETGAVRGQVLDDQGLPVPGAVVVITGENIAGEREVTTDANGEFRTLGLPPGPKEVLIKKEGFAPTRYTVTVRLDETAFVPVSLKAVGGAGEEIIVTETLPVVDATRSTVSQQMTNDLLQNVPTGRSYQSAVNMVPGVYGRIDTQNGGPSTGNPSVRGEGQYGNNYLVDGISTRDPATKTFGSNVNFDAIQEIQVYTDGYPAEFSNATGMLVNVVTKDGGNEHFGSASYFLDMSACNDMFAKDDGLSDIKKRVLTGELSGDAYDAELNAYKNAVQDKGCYYDVRDSVIEDEIPTRKRSVFDNELSLTAGGPILKDKLWYFGALTLDYDKDRYEGQSQENPYIGKSWEALAKVTWFATNDLSFQVQFSGSGTAVDNYETSPLYDISAQSQRRESSLSPTLTARYRPNEKSEWELKATYWNLALDQVPMSGDDQEPEIQDQNSYNSNNYDSFDYNLRKRLGGSLKWTHLVEDMFGDHRFKAGAELWKVSSSREIVYTGQAWDSFFDSQAWSDAESVDDTSGYLFYRDTSDSDGDGQPDYPCTAANNYLDCAGYRQSDVVDPIPGTSNLFGLFFQDDWTIKPLTFNLGMRIDHETDFQSDGTKIIDFWMPAPRLGAAWDITGDSKTVMTVNAGRYYDVNGTSFVQWANTRSSNKYSEYRANGDGTYDLDFQQDPAGNPLIYCTQQSLDQLVDLEQLDRETADNIWSEFCGNQQLRPYHMDKLVVGIKREIIPLLAVGIKGILSHTQDFPEDVDYDLDYWVVTNPTDSAGNSQKVRDYKALEFTVERKFDGVWQLLGSYTLSEATGHMPGQFELASGGSTGSDGNEVGVYMDDVNDQATRDFYFENGYGWLMDGLAGLGRKDDDSYYGLLPYSSYHQVKLAGSYKLPTNTTIGAVYEFDSGHAWQKRGYVYLYGDYFSFPEGRGTRFMPAVNYVNLRVSQEIKFTDRQNLEISLDVLNALDLQTPVTYYENEGEAFGEVMYRQSPLEFRVGATYKY